MTQSDCWKCGEPGHLAYTCTLQLRAASHAEHMARIAVIVERWIAGKISTETKRIRISEENVQWYGPDVPRRLVYAPAPDA
jgi:hypothetical protein